MASRLNFLFAGVALVAALIVLLGVTVLYPQLKPHSASAPESVPAIAALPGSAVATATDLGRQAKAAEAVAETVALNCMWVAPDECAAFVERVLANSKLKAALQYAREQNVTVSAADSFYIGKASVSIAINSSDEKIIRFLLGGS